jgi:hypothetical protein
LVLLAGVEAPVEVEVAVGEHGSEPEDGFGTPRPIRASPPLPAPVCSTSSPCPMRSASSCPPATHLGPRALATVRRERLAEAGARVLLLRRPDRGCQSPGRVGADHGSNWRSPR